MLFLAPSDVLRPRRADEHFAEEVAAARAAGFEVALVDHDALRRPGGADEAVRRVPGGGTAVYRGWMLRAGDYAAFAAALARRGVTLRTSPAQYQRAHELPGWQRELRDWTPRSAWTAGTARADFDRARAELGPGPAVLRDYSKSLKHHWQEAAFIPELADAEASWAVAARFLELRDTDLDGGFVLRAFEEFASAELRTWWVDGVCRLTGPHPDTPEDRPGTPDLSALTPRISALGLPFLTADLVRRADGVWRVVELGDGQVSDRPRTIPAAALLAALTPQFQAPAAADSLT